MPIGMSSQYLNRLIENADVSTRRRFERFLIYTGVAIAHLIFILWGWQG